MTDGTELPMDVVTDDDAAPGDPIPALARLLLALADERQEARADG